MSRLRIRRAQRKKAARPYLEPIIETWPGKVTPFGSSLWKRIPCEIACPKATEVPRSRCSSGRRSDRIVVFHREIGNRCHYRESMATRRGLPAAPAEVKNSGQGSARLNSRNIAATVCRGERCLPQTNRARPDHLLYPGLNPSANRCRLRFTAAPQRLRPGIRCVNRAPRQRGRRERDGASAGRRVSFWPGNLPHSAIVSPPSGS
jgi:hypothetical protein